MKTRVLTGLLCCLLVTVPVAIGGQELLLRHDGTISATGVRLHDGAPVQWHEVQSPSQTLLWVHVVSVDFVPRVVIDAPGRPLEFLSGERGAVIASVPIASSERVRVGVATSSASEAGGYSLRIETGATAVRLQVGRSVSGFLPPAGPLGERPILYEYRGRAGEGVRIRIESDDFDTYLTVTDRSGNRMENDDAGDGTTNSELVYLFDTAGALMIQASSFGGFGSGRFNITVSDLPEAVAYEPGKLLNDGDDVVGLLSLRDAEILGRRARHYTVSVTAGREIDILLSSNDFDAYLVAETPSGLLYEDDDSGGDLDARLNVMAEEGGIWSVFVTSYSGSDTGVYRLSYRQRAPMELVRRFSGTLRQPGRIVEGRAYQQHTIETEAGREYRVDLRSDDFDTYLLVLDASGSIVAENDDFGMGTDSRVEFRAGGGVYTILAGPFGAEASGRYSIEVRR